MKASPVLRFEFSPARDPNLRNDGWGQGTLQVYGRPYWFFNSESEPKPVEWTWVDFLEHVAEVWGSLIAEQAYPFNWLDEATHPGELWKVADRRWAKMGGTVADQEEPLLVAFDRRHNLSAAWKGIGLPALTWFRVGETVWLCPEGGDPIRASFHECRSALVSLGNELADAYSASSNARVATAVSAWRGRGEVFRSHFPEIATGLSRDQILSIQGGQNASSYWEFSSTSDWESGQVAEGELLAAARMTAGILDTASIGRVVRDIRRLSNRICEELDTLTAKTSAHVASVQARFAFEAGYCAADFFKVSSSITNQKYVDIREVLGRLNVGLIDLDLGTNKIDAVAIWGTRGPYVVLNSVRKYAENEKRTRMTLAHELCHLLVDRKGGLPFCEVLGGQVDDFVERRASAFAAELLLPRESVEYDWRLWRDGFQDFLLMLGQVYGVSKSVACAQIHNCTVFAKLDHLAQDYVEKRLRIEGYTNPEAVRVVAGVV